jgi:hypothetical protein
MTYFVFVPSSEAELVGAAFTNAQKAVPMRQALHDMGHPQPPTPLKTDNSTAHGILTSLVKQKRSKAFDMRFYWLKDRINQKQFHVYWKPGNENLADYKVVGSYKYVPTDMESLWPMHSRFSIKSLCSLIFSVTFGLYTKSGSLR